MSKHTHIVVVYDHDTKSFSYDEDGTDVWIRDLFSPTSSTYCTEEEDYVADDALLATTIKSFNELLKGGFL